MPGKTRVNGLNSVPSFGEKDGRKPVQALATFATKTKILAGLDKSSGEVDADGGLDFMFVDATGADNDKDPDNDGGAKEEAAI